MAAQHFFAKAWSLSFERFSKKIRDFVKNLLLKQFTRKKRILISGKIHEVLFFKLKNFLLNFSLPIKGWTAWQFNYYKTCHFDVNLALALFILYILCKH